MIILISLINAVWDRRSVVAVQASGTFHRLPFRRKDLHHALLHRQISSRLADIRWGARYECALTFPRKVGLLGLTLISIEFDTHFN